MSIKNSDRLIFAVDVPEIEQAKDLVTQLGPSVDFFKIGMELMMTGITAETKDNIIMGIMHKKYNLHGVQFHPESINTKEGIKLIKNFLKY